MKLPINYEESHWSVRKMAREQYVKKQNGLCHFCGETLSKPPEGKVSKVAVNAGLFPANFFKSPVHLHHCHNTGMTIGAVHAKCNAVLWQHYGE